MRLQNAMPMRTPATMKEEGMLQTQIVGTSAPMIAPLMGNEPIRRRAVLGGSVALAATTGVTPAGAAPGLGPGPALAGRSGGGYFAYTGCRTSRERNARGDGINVFRVDASTGHWEHVQLV